MPWLESQPSLPWRGKSAHARHSSYTGSVAAAPRSGSQAAMVLQALRDTRDYMRADGCTYHELAYWTGLPLATICARMNALAKRGLVESCGVVPGPYGAKRTQWRAR